MTTFETPEPTTADIEVPYGRVRITATDRTDTVVEVHPSRAGNDADTQAAQNTVVRCSGAVLTVTAPKRSGGGLIGMIGLFGGAGSVDIDIALPSGSAVRGKGSAATFIGSGRLGDCQIQTSAGDVTLDETGPLTLSTTSGHLAVEHVTGRSTISNGNGNVRLGTLDGPAEVKNSNGDTRIDVGTDGLRVRAANGSITIDRASGEVAAKSANGKIRVDAMAGGRLDIKTACGDLHVGVVDGCAAWLDVNTSFGRIRNEMDPATAPEPADGTESVELRARTSYGDITIRRAQGASS